MPALPWVQKIEVDPSVTYVAMASRLPLKRRRSVPGFLRDAMAIRRQLRSAKGLVGFALDAEIGKKTFWTFSVWETRDDLDVFARSEPHHAIINRLRPHMGQSRFEFLSLPGERLPMTWQQMKAPLNQPPPQ
jgi:heme-degrading monooxygenase HmoA